MDYWPSKHLSRLYQKKTRCKNWPKALDCLVDVWPWSDYCEMYFTMVSWRPLPCLPGWCCWRPLDNESSRSQLLVRKLTPSKKHSVSIYFKEGYCNSNNNPKSISRHYRLSTNYKNCEETDNQITGWLHCFWNPRLHLFIEISCRIAFQWYW